MRGLAVASVLIALAACAPTTTPTSPSPSSGLASTPSPYPLGASGCQPISPPGAFLAERYATSQGGGAWAWFMAAWPPTAGVEDKTVWRLNPDKFSSSAATPAFTLSGPAGAQGHLNWGPDAHSGSSWTRPGAEFGTGLVFTIPGCWDAHVTYGSLQADIYLLVTPS